MFALSDQLLDFLSLFAHIIIVVLSYFLLGCWQLAKIGAKVRISGDNAKKKHVFLFMKPFTTLQLPDGQWISVKGLGWGGWRANGGVFLD